MDHIQLLLKYFKGVKLEYNLRKYYYFKIWSKFEIHNDTQQIVWKL